MTSTKHWVGGPFRLTQSPTFEQQVALDIDFHRTMFELHQRVNPKEVIIGWYATGDGITSTDTLIHDFYGHETVNPVHVTVDTTFSGTAEVVNAYVGAPVTLSTANGSIGMQFQRVALDLQFAEAERVGLELLQTTQLSKV